MTEADIDEDLRGVFRVMIRLGLLDPPEDVPYSEIGVKPAVGTGRNSGEPWTWPLHRLVARRATDESIVLLKNENAALPLDAAQLKSIAVIGPYADQVDLDWYSGTPPYGVSPLDGIRNAAGDGVKVTFHRGDILGRAAAVAKASDVAIVIVGNHPTCDAGWNVCLVKSSGKEGIDRKSLTLDDEELIKRVYAANPRTVVVLIASFPYAIGWTEANIPAILTMTHNSQEEGNGLADVLFGRYNPGGRLTQTWPASMDQLPPMMDYDIRHGRTYMYMQAKPLYAFGYGLSYTSFAYSGLRLTTPALPANGSVGVYFTVKNTGSRAGDEVAQLYVTHIGSRVQRPLKELKAFARVSLRAGESREIGLLLKASDLAYWDVSAQRFQVEQDRIKVTVGGSSDDPKLDATLPVTP
jgi:beta-glucosidase